MQRSLATASASLKAFGSTATTAGATATRASTVFKAGFVLAGVAAADAIGKGIAATQEWAGEVRSLQRVTGQTAEQASALAGGAASLGIGVDKLAIGFGFLAKNIVNGAPNLVKYGVAVRDTKGQLLPFDGVLQNVIQRYSELPTQMDKAAFAQNAFGKGGKALIPILDRGVAGLDDLRKAAADAGLVMSQDTLDAARDLSIAQRELSESVKGASISLGQAFIPIAQKAVDVLTFIVQAFVAIPAPLKTAALSLAVITGAIAAFNLVVGFTSKAWTTFLGTIGVGGTAQEKLAADAGLAAGAMGVEAGATEGLTLAIQGLTAALGVELPAATGRAELALAGYGATESGLIVPTEALTASQVALGGAMAGTATKLGFFAKAWLGLKGLIGTFGAVGSAALGVLAFTPELPAQGDLQKIEDFVKFVRSDQADLASGTSLFDDASLKASIQGFTDLAVATGADRRAFGLAAREGITYSAALDEMARRAEKLAGSQSTAQLVAASFRGQIRDLFSTVTDGATKFSDISGALDLFGGAVGNLEPVMDHLTQVSGQDFTKIGSDLLTALSTATVEQAPAIFQASLGEVSAIVKAWHDSIVANFGGAAGAIQEFAGQTSIHSADVVRKLTDLRTQFANGIITEDTFKSAVQGIRDTTVSFGDLSGALDSQRSDLRRWQHDFNTILSSSGDAAQTFLQDMSAQGLDSLGTLDEVARQPAKIRDEFLANYAQVNKATGSVATTITTAFGGAIDKLLQGFLDIFNAYLKAQGLAPITLGVDTAQAEAALKVLQDKLAGLAGRHEILVHTTFTSTGGGTGSGGGPGFDFAVHSGGQILHEGGAVQRFHSGSLASDEVPAVLQRGEFVMQRSAVQKIGVPALAAMNKMHTGGAVGGTDTTNTTTEVRVIATSIERAFKDVFKTTTQTTGTLGNVTPALSLAARAKDAASLFALMDTNVKAFLADARKAADPKHWHDFAQAIRQDAVAALKSFHDQAVTSLDFASGALSELTSAAQSAAESLKGNDLTGGALARLRDESKLTGLEILKAFQTAAKETRAFGRDLLEISRVGGQAGKDLSAELLSTGNVLAAKTIANAPHQMQVDIVHAFSEAGKAADNLATKLTRSIAGSLKDIEKILRAIARKWDIKVNLSTSGGAIAKQHAGGPIMHDVARFHSGGLRSDEVPAILQKGEYVIRASAAARLGTPALDAINRLHAGGAADALRLLQPAQPMQPSVVAPKVNVNVRVAEPRPINVKVGVEGRRFGRDLDYVGIRDGYFQ